MEKVERALALIDEILQDYKNAPPAAQLGCQGQVRFYGEKGICIACQLQLIKNILKEATE